MALTKAKSKMIDVNDLAQALNFLPSPVRQTALSGGVDANGYANFISAGTGLACNLSVTTAPVILTFANGFGVQGQVDYIGSITSEMIGYWSSLPAYNTSFLSIDRNSSTGALTSSQTLIPPQYGQFYDRTKATLLHF